MKSSERQTPKSSDCKINITIIFQFSTLSRNFFSRSHIETDKCKRRAAHIPKPLNKKVVYFFLASYNNSMSVKIQLIQLCGFASMIGLNLEESIAFSFMFIFIRNFNFIFPFTVMEIYLPRTFPY